VLIEARDLCSALRVLSASMGVSASRLGIVGVASPAICPRRVHQLRFPGEASVSQKPWSGGTGMAAERWWEHSAMSDLSGKLGGRSNDIRKDVE